jgi:hypothetical protein
MTITEWISKHRSTLVLGALGLIAVVWIVRGEMRRFRDSTVQISHEIVREGMDQAADEAGSVIEQAGKESRDTVREIIKSAGELIDKAATVSGEITGDPSRGNKGSPPPDEQDAEETKKESDSADSVSSRDREVSPSTDEQDAEETKKEPVSTDDVISGAFDLFSGLAKRVDDVGQEVLGLSVDEQNRIGRQTHDLIIKQEVRLNSTNQLARLKRLSQPFIERSSRQGISFTFTVLKSAEINAFTHVGGYVYVNQGLLDFAQSDRELEFILGHEIGHVQLQHCTRAVTYAARTSDLGGELAGQLGSELATHLSQTAYRLVSLGYSEEQEFAADQWAYRQLIELGRSRDDALAGPRLLAEHEAKGGRDNDRSQPENSVDTLFQELDNHFRTHPPSAERLRRLENQ